jgi:hypothetical protein
MSPASPLVRFKQIQAFSGGRSLLAKAFPGRQITVKLQVTPDSR